MEKWSDGKMEYWRDGGMEKWSVGVKVNLKPETRNLKPET